MNPQEYPPCSRTTHNSEDRGEEEQGKLNGVASSRARKTLFAFSFCKHLHTKRGKMSPRERIMGRGWCGSTEAHVFPCKLEGTGGRGGCEDAGLRLRWFVRWRGWDALTRPVVMVCCALRVLAGCRTGVWPPIFMAGTCGWLVLDESVARRQEDLYYLVISHVLGMRVVELGESPVVVSFH